MWKVIALSLVASVAIGFVHEAEAKEKMKISCRLLPAAEWIPLLQITDKAKELGYDVWKVERKDGCWKVKGYDKNGASITASFDPGTGKLVSKRDMLLSSSQKP
jgi:hypothetical protein